MFPSSRDQEEFNTTHIEVFKVPFRSLTISRYIDTSYEYFRQKHKIREIKSVPLKE